MPYLSLLLTAALVAGLAWGVAADVPPPVAARAGLALAWLAGVVAWRRGARHVQLASAAAACACAGWLLGGAAVAAALHPPLREVLDRRHPGFALGASGGARLDEPVLVEGRLLADAAVVPAGVSLRMAVTRIWIGAGPVAADGGVAVSVGGEMAAGQAGHWRAGRLLRAPMFLRRPAVYLNPGVPDGERALARRGIALVGSVKSAALVEVVGEARWWDRAAAAVRARTRTAVARWVGMDAPQAVAVATAILIGDRAAMDPDVERRLQEAGTYHVVAISGGNIAIFAGLVLAILALSGAGPTFSAAAAIIVVAGYAVVAGGGASVARAALMAIVYLAVRLVDQRTAVANAVAITAAALLLYDPLTVLDVGAWLTFGATAAILLGASRLPVATGWARQAVALLVASACAEVVLLPVAASVFQRVTLAGLGLNFVAIPAMGVVQLAAMALVTADVFGLTPLAAAAGWVTRVAAGVLLESGRLLDVAPWLAWRVPAPALWLVGLYYGALAAWWWGSRPPGDRLVRRRLARTAALVAVASGLWIAVCPPALARRMGDGRLHLRAIDVGQGESLLVTFPNGRTLLVDAGGLSEDAAFDVGDRVVGPALRALGLVRLDYLAFTHGDADHLGGTRAVVRDFTPLEVWQGVPVPPHAPTAALHELAGRRRAAWRTLQRGDQLEMGGATLTVLHPPPPDWERQKPRNDDSLVFEIRYGDVSFVLTGDISREVEAALLPTLALAPTVVLKVGHHGSGTSSSAAFLEALHPVVALISAGRGNAYGHPRPAVIAGLKRVGAAVYRTDLNGAVEVSTGGRDVRVEAFVEGGS
ncbi:MAG: DNA internalization-related competence protein ComEC/Rec2 [Vicinamibacterales bacterium]